MKKRRRIGQLRWSVYFRDACLVFGLIYYHFWGMRRSQALGRRQLRRQSEVSMLFCRSASSKHRHVSFRPWANGYGTAWPASHNCLLQDGHSNLAQSKIEVISVWLFRIFTIVEADTNQCLGVSGFFLAYDAYRGSRNRGASGWTPGIPQMSLLSVSWKIGPLARETWTSLDCWL